MTKKSLTTVVTTPAGPVVGDGALLRAVDEAITGTVHVASEAEACRAAVREVLAGAWTGLVVQAWAGDDPRWTGLVDVIAGAAPVHHEDEETAHA